MGGGIGAKVQQWCERCPFAPHRSHRELPCIGMAQLSLMANYKHAHAIMVRPPESAIMVRPPWHDHKLRERDGGFSKLCNTEQACATQHFSCNHPQQALAAKTKSISTEAATHKNGVLGRQTCQAAWWTDLPGPLASAISRRLRNLDHRPGTSCPE